MEGITRILFYKFVKGCLSHTCLSGRENGRLYDPQAQTTPLDLTLDNIQLQVNNKHTGTRYPF